MPIHTQSEALIDYTNNSLRIRQPGLHPPTIVVLTDNEASQLAEQLTWNIPYK